MFSSLDRIDIVTQRTDGRKEYWQTDHRTAEEIEEQRALSVLFALTRLLNPLRGAQPGEPPPVVVYAAHHPPPPLLRDVIRAAGGLLTIGNDLDPRPIPPPSPQPGGSFFGRIRGMFGGASNAAPAGPLLDDIIQQAFAALAGGVAAEHGVALDLDGLQTVEDAIAATSPDQEEDETAYWTAVFELGAFGGEVLRALNGGRWVQQGELGALPFVLATPYRGDESKVNPLGKAIKRFQNGEEDSLVALVKVIRAGR